MRKQIQPAHYREVLLNQLAKPKLIRTSNIKVGRQQNHATVVQSTSKTSPKKKNKAEHVHVLGHFDGQSTASEKNCGGGPNLPIKTVNEISNMECEGPKQGLHAPRSQVQKSSTQSHFCQSD